MIRLRVVARTLMLLQLLAGVVFVTAWEPGARADSFAVTNLVTDDQAANPAQITDPGLVNAWGISYSSSSPFWVSSNGTGVSNLYSVDPSTDATSKLGLTVAIPGDGSVTGQVSNGTSGFNGDRFLFVSEDGTISGWRGALGTTAEILQLPSDAVYKGAALATVGNNTYLLRRELPLRSHRRSQGYLGYPRPCREVHRSRDFLLAMRPSTSNCWGTNSTSLTPCRAPARMSRPGRVWAS